MKEIIERAERLGYKPYFFDNIWNYAEDEYIELCLIQKWLMEDKNLYIAIKEDTIFVNNVWVGDFESYVEALEEGIKKALEILEK